MPVGVAQCSNRAAVLETSLLTVLKSSLPKLPCQVCCRWLRELVPVQRGWPQSCLEDEAGWQLRLPGCVVCSKGELPPRPGLGGSTSMVRTVQVSHTHSPFSSLGTQLPVSGQLMWWECILHAAGLGFVMTQRAGESQGLAAASHASQCVGEAGAETFRCRGTSWGCRGDEPFS